MRFAVVTNLDGYLRCFGTFADQDAAEAFAAKVNARIEREEARLWEEFDNRDTTNDDGLQLAPDGLGRAHVLTVRTPRVRVAVKAAEGRYDL